MNTKHLQRASAGAANSVGVVSPGGRKDAVKTNTLHLPDKRAATPPPQAAKGDDDLMSQPQVAS